MPALNYDYEYLANYRPETKRNKLEVYRKMQAQKEQAYKKTSKKTKEQVRQFMLESMQENRTMPRARKTVKAKAIEAEVPNQIELDEVEEVVEPKVKAHVSTENVFSALKNIPLFLVFAVVALFICYRYSIINEKFNTVEKAKKELLNAQTINEQLQAEIDSETDISYVENYAKYQLGMQKPQDSQIMYLNVEKQDRIFTPVNLEEAKESSWISNLLQKIAEIF